MLLFWKTYLVPQIEWLMQRIEVSIQKKLNSEARCTAMVTLKKIKLNEKLNYCWKINSDVDSEIVSCNHIRHGTQGRKCEMKRIIGKNKICTKLEQSFSIQGPKLFNLLPEHLRDVKGV